MQRKNESLVITALLFQSLSPFSAWAGNSTDRGGGDVVVFDDRVVIADPWFKRTADEEGLNGCPEGTEGTLNPQLQNELKRAGRILSTYGAKSPIVFSKQPVNTHL